MVLESGQHPAQLKDDVQSPAGSSIYAMHQLENSAFRCFPFHFFCFKLHKNVLEVCLFPPWRQRVIARVRQARKSTWRRQNTLCDMRYKTLTLDYAFIHSASPHEELSIMLLGQSHCARTIIHYRHTIWGMVSLLT